VQVEVGERALPLVARDPAARAFVDRYLGGRRLTPVDVFATTGQVELRQLGWTFRRAPELPGGACVAEPGFRAAAVAPHGRDLEFRFNARTESPVTAEVVRVASARPLRSPNLVARLVRAEPFTWVGPRSRRADGIYVARLTTLTPGGRVDERRFALQRHRGRFRALPAYVTLERCELLRSFALSSPAFGGARRPTRLGVSVSTVEPARAVLRLRRGRRTVRRLRLGTVRPGHARELRLAAARLRRGRYAVELTVTAPGGRSERARLHSERL
jgi:hypothetical protein